MIRPTHCNYNTPPERRRVLSSIRFDVGRSKKLLKFPRKTSTQGDNKASECQVFVSIGYKQSFEKMNGPSNATGLNEMMEISVY